MALALSRTPLFGGAMAAPLPTGYLDASDLRQIPDNQEVFLAPTSNASLIISLLERVDDNGGGIEGTLHIHFEDAVLGATGRREDAAAAAAGGGDGVVMKPVRRLAPGPSGAVFEGEVAQAGVLVAAVQTPLSHEAGGAGLSRVVTAKEEEQVVFTGVVMGLVRLRVQTTDVLVEFHVPHVAGQYDASAINLNAMEFGPAVGQAYETVRQVIDGLEVLDWNLFGS